MSWLRLDLCRRLVFLARLLFRNGFRSPLEVLFTELEFRHAVLTIHTAPLGFEHYVGIGIPHSFLKELCEKCLRTGP